MRSASIERARAIADKVRQRNQHTWDEVDREVVFAINALVAHAEWLYMRNEQMAAAERNKLAAWMHVQGYTTGHGDTIEGLLEELRWQVEERGQDAP
jgi:hypothetical protein